MLKIGFSSHSRYEKTIFIRKFIFDLQNLTPGCFTKPKSLKIFCSLSGTCMKTVAGETMEVLDPGLRNRDSGPDFFNARVKIGKTLWAGNIEIHKNSSDWKKHHHRTMDRTTTSFSMWFFITTPL